MQVEPITLEVYWVTLPKANRFNATLGFEVNEKKHTERQFLDRVQQCGPFIRPETIGKLAGECAAFLRNIQFKLSQRSRGFEMMFDLKTIPTKRLRSVALGSSIREELHLPLSDSEVEILFQAYTESRGAETRKLDSMEIRHRAYDPSGLGGFRDHDPFNRDFG